MTIQAKTAKDKLVALGIPRSLLRVTTERIRRTYNGHTFTEYGKPQITLRRKSAEQIIIDDPDRFAAAGFDIRIYRYTSEITGNRTSFACIHDNFRVKGEVGTVTYRELDPK